MAYLSYDEQLKTEEWEKKRTEIAERDNYTCYFCGYHGLLLNVHHFKYLPEKMAWEHPNDLLFTLCRGCHELVHKDRVIHDRIEATKISSLIPKALKNISTIS